MVDEQVHILTSYIVGIILGLATFVPIGHSHSVVNDVNDAPVGWTDDVKLTDAPIHGMKPNIAVDGSNIQITWEGWSGSTVDAFHMHSNDGGRNWSAPYQISNSGILAENPDVAVEGENAYVFWQDWKSLDWEIFYRNSTDGGDSWSPETRVTNNDDEASQGPKIALNDTNLHLIWVDNRHKAESFPWNTEIFYKRSTDGGITWDDGLGNVGQERRLTNALYSSAPNGIALNGSNIHIIWVDYRNGNFDIYYKRSLNNGATWDDGQGNVNQDRRLTTNSTGHGSGTIVVNDTTIHVAWVDEIWPGPFYKIYYINSTDNGATWSPIQELVGSLYSHAPDLDVIGNTVHFTWHDWRDDGSTTEIYYKNSTDGGGSWGAETRLTYNLGNYSMGPVIGVDDQTVNIIWADNRGGADEIYYKRYPDFPPPDSTHNITFNEGWNLVSFPLIQSDESLDSVLESINGKWDCIQVYDPLSPEPWKSNNTFRPDLLNDFSSLNHMQGFWINITESNVNLTVRGHIPTSTSINLYAGWNLIGYPTMTEKTVANALWGTGADKVEVFDPGEPYRIREVGPTYLMKPGEGYWVHVPADTTWVVDW